MLTAKVLGTATATVKHPTLAGCKLLVVQPYVEGSDRPDGDPLIVVDRQGAGRGETVLITSDGRIARETLGSENTPVRWTTLGIVDE